VVFSVVLAPTWPWLHGYLKGEPAHFEIALLLLPMLFVSLALVLAGIALGFLLYGKAGTTDPLAQTQPALFRFLVNKMWLDELYARTVIAWSVMLARLSDWMDRHIWDGLVRGFGGI